MKNILIILLSVLTMSANMSTAKGQKRNSYLEERLNATLNERTTDLQKKMVLVEYEYQPQITSTWGLIEALNAIFSDDAYIAVQEYTNFDFTLHKIKDMKEMEKKSNFKRFNLKELKFNLLLILRKYIKDGGTLDLVKLKWLHNNKDTVYSTAIATEEGGIFYETIGHLIMDPKSNQFADNSYSFANKSEENVENYQNRRFNHTFHCYNLFGETVCSFTIDCISKFNADGVLIDRKQQTSTKTVEGYSCSNSAGFKSSFGTTSNEFVWKWSYTSGSITPENKGFEETGTITHSLKDEKIIINMMSDRTF